jgi:hypothetical protein
VAQQEKTIKSQHLRITSLTGLMIAGAALSLKRD